MKLNRRVTIITRFSGIMFSLLLLGGLAACSDDNNGSDTPEPEPSTYPTTPFSKIELKEVIESDAQPVTATHTYLYNSAGRLTSYTGKQSFTAGDELFEIENTTTVEYKDHQAVITDEAGTVSTYTLNDKGYATTCTSQDMAGNTRTYTFSYLINTEDKYYLENITEKLDDGKGYCHPHLPLQQCRQADQLHRQTELYSRRRTLRDREYHYCRIQGPSSRDNRRSRYSINLHAE